MELTYTDASWARAGALRAFSLDMEFGGGEATNDFELAVPPGVFLEVGALVYADGTEYGGVVDGFGIDCSKSPAKRTYTGRTWHGVLAGKVVVPEGDHFSVEGDANACVAAVIDRVGDCGLFEAESAPSGIEVPRFDLPRFCDAYTGLRRMLASAGARLSVARERGRVLLSAVPASPTVETSATCASLRLAANERPVNHLVCAGEGEGGERAVVHLYADASGAVSREQSLFGLDEVAELYSFTTADEERLVEGGTERLRGYQDAVEASMSVPEGGPLTVGDVVSCRVPEAGASASAEVESVVVSVGPNGARVSPQLGEAAAAEAGARRREP